MHLNFLQVSIDAYKIHCNDFDDASLKNLLDLVDYDYATNFSERALCLVEWNAAGLYIDSLCRTVLEYLF